MEDSALDLVEDKWKVKNRVTSSRPRQPTLHQRKLTLLSKMQIGLEVVVNVKAKTFILKEHMVLHLQTKEVSWIKIVLILMVSGVFI